MAGTTYDPEKFQLSIARLKRGGHTFEIVIEPDAALAYRAKKKVPIEDCIQYEKIFMDAQKGLLASENLMEEVFQTTSATEIAKRILMDGDVHLTAKYRQQLRDQKQRQIVDRIHTYGVDPRTKVPHPVERIERAIAESNVRIDEFQTVQDQTKEVVKKLQSILPISFAEKRIRVEIPAEHAAKAYGAVHRLADIQKETWQSDGSWAGEVQIPAGLEHELYDKLNSITHGAVKTEIIQTKVK